MKNKFLPAILIGASVLSLTACSSNKDNNKGYIAINTDDIYYSNYKSVQATLEAKNLTVEAIEGNKADGSDKSGEVYDVAFPYELQMPEKYIGDNIITPTESTVVITYYK